MRRNDARGRDGMVSLLAAVSLVALAGISALAVDIAFLHMKRADIQTAADTGALAGVAAILSKGDPAGIRQAVLEVARENIAAADGPTAAVTPSDIVLYRDGMPDETNPNQVEVTVRLARDRENQAELFFGKWIGRKDAELSATARAGLVPVCSSRCAKPFIVPAKFTWDDTAAGAGSSFYLNGSLDTASAGEMASVVVLGYSQPDVGTQIVLKYGSARDTIVPSQYQAIDYPPVNKGDPVTGASAFEENISGCTGANTVLLELGDEMYLEPGNMSGPADKGFADLVAEDPLAYWDESTRSIKGSAWPNPLNSPRVSIIPFYDPRRPPVSGRNTLFVHQLGAVFIEANVGKGEIRARFINTLARNPSSATGQCLLVMARLLRDSSRGGSEGGGS
jgi:hypothetical protein